MIYKYVYHFETQPCMYNALVCMPWGTQRSKVKSPFFQIQNPPREGSGAVAMVSNDLLCIQNELVWNRDGLQVSRAGLWSLLPQPRKARPLERG